MCVRERLAEFIPGPEALGGQPLRFGDIDFDDWVLDEHDPPVRWRRDHGSH